MKIANYMHQQILHNLFDGSSLKIGAVLRKIGCRMQKKTSILHDEKTPSTTQTISKNVSPSSEFTYVK